MPPELPVSENLRALSLQRLYNCQSRRCRLDDAQKRIFGALDASAIGLSMDELRGKRPKSYEGYLTISLSEMRDKLRDFFRYEGWDLSAVCHIPELRKDESPEGNTEGTRLNGRYDRWKSPSYLRASEPMLTLRSLPHAVAS